MDEFLTINHWLKKKKNARIPVTSGQSKLDLSWKPVFHSKSRKPEHPPSPLFLWKVQVHTLVKLNCSRSRVQILPAGAFTMKVWKMGGTSGGVGWVGASHLSISLPNNFQALGLTLDFLIFSLTATEMSTPTIFQAARLCIMKERMG